MLLDNISRELVTEAVLKSRDEKGRRMPIHIVHRWWSRRFVATYRLILGAYLFDDEKRISKALDTPKIMREYASGKTFFEPFAGGGTGLVEAALAGFNVYGIDINPVAVITAKASLLLVTYGLPKNFENKLKKVLTNVKEKTRDLWEFNGNYITYIFITRRYIPTWLSTCKNHHKVILCSHCYRIFETKSMLTAICPYCGKQLEITNKPIAEPPPEAPDIANGWKAFAIELRKCINTKCKKKYLSVAESTELASWLQYTAQKARVYSSGLDEILGDISSIHEANRLIKVNMKKATDIFAPHQLATFIAYAEALKKIVNNNKEKLLFTVALSEATKCCSLLAKWYSPLGECIPAGGMKALWVPEYTVITNPIAFNGFKTLARGTLISAFKAQLKAMKYVDKVGGVSNIRSTVVLGDALTAPYPRSANLVVLDPPYGKFKSYASLSLPHFYSLKILDEFLDLDIEIPRDLSLIENKELMPWKEDFQDAWSLIIRRISEILHPDSRVVLVFTTLASELWEKMLRPFKLHNLYPTAVYWVLGEAPSALTTSKLKGIHLIVFRKSKRQCRLHTILDEPIKVASNVNSIDESLEKKSSESLMSALRKLYNLN
jgi:adenine-specific DNA methylase